MSKKKGLVKRLLENIIVRYIVDIIFNWQGGLFFSLVFILWGYLKGFLFITIPVTIATIFGGIVFGSLIPITVNLLKKSFGKSFKDDREGVFRGLKWRWEYLGDKPRMNTLKAYCPNCDMELNINGWESTYIICSDKSCPKYNEDDPLIYDIPESEFKSDIIRRIERYLRNKYDGYQ